MQEVNDRFRSCSVPFPSEALARPADARGLVRVTADLARPVVRMAVVVMAALTAVRVIVRIGHWSPFRVRCHTVNIPTCSSQ